LQAASTVGAQKPTPGGMPWSHLARVAQEIEMRGLRKPASLPDSARPPAGRLMAQRV
jgi:hypothetical protein